MALFGSPNIEKLKSKKDLPALIKALDYIKQPQIRAQAAGALGEIGDQQATEPLLERLSKYTREDDRAVISALGKLRDPRAVPVLVGRLRENGITGSALELSALQGIGDPAVPPLLEVLQETSKETRLALILIEKLKNIGNREAIDGLISMLSPTKPNLIPHLVDIFVKMGESQTAPILAALLESGPSEDWAAHVVEGLLKMGWQAESRLEKIALFLAHREWEKLADIGDPAVEYLTPLLRNSRSEIILPVIKTLESISDDSSVEPLAGLLEDRRPEIAASAARSLGKIRSEQAVEPLLQALLNIEDPSVQAEAKNALILIGAAAVPYLLACLESMDPQERYLSIVLLGEIADEQAVLPLKTQLNSINLKEKKAAVRSLAQIGGSKAVEALVPMLDDPKLQSEVKTSLAQLGWTANLS